MTSPYTFTDAVRNIMKQLGLHYMYTVREAGYGVFTAIATFPGHSNFFGESVACCRHDAIVEVNKKIYFHLRDTGRIPELDREGKPQRKPCRDDYCIAQEESERELWLSDNNYSDLEHCDYDA